MAKKCVFCGKEVKSKSKEHVIPQWLIKHTNRTDKLIYINPNITAFKYMSFTFPACKECNEKYSKLESATKPVLLNLMDGRAVTPEQIDILLDWFDKVRIGLWLGQLQINKKMDEINPHLFIENRTGKTDRLLSIERIQTNPNDQGIAFAGTATPSFETTPCAWQLIINDYVFTNASSHMLFSGRLGFPYANKLYINDGAECSLDLTKGKNRIIKPIIKNWQPATDSVTLYQPIFSAVLDPDSKKEFYSGKYVLEHCLDADRGRGGIFYQRGDKGPVEYLTHPISIKPKPRNGHQSYAMAMPVFDLQDIVTNQYECKSQNPIVRANYKQQQMMQILQNKQYRAICKKHCK